MSLRIGIAEEIKITGIDSGTGFDLNRTILQGLFLAPQMVSEALIGADLVAGVFAELGYNNSYFKSLISLLIGTLIIFLFGVGYLGSIIGYDKALAGGLYPFIPSEFFKIGLAVVLIPSITRYISK